jgi:hypothetical protein
MAISMGSHAISVRSETDIAVVAQMVAERKFPLLVNVHMNPALNPRMYK